MQIGEEKINKYIALYFEEYGKKIDPAQAIVELEALVCLLEAVEKFNNKQSYE